MSVSVAQLSKFQFNWNDAPIVGGLLFTYAAGTTTKLTTYQDSFGAVPNTNPIVLDANGQCNLYLTDGLSYKFTLSPPGDTDPPTNPYWTVDNILSAASAASGTLPIPVASGGTGKTTVPLAIAALALSERAFVNRVINGGFTINQRVYVTNTALGAGVYAHDRWKAGSGGCTYTFTQPAAGVPCAINITAGTLQQVIEGCNLPEGGTYTLQWAGTAQARVNGGSYSASPLTVTGLTAGSNATVEFNAGTITGPVQFEVGAVASPIDYRAFAEEFKLCERYYGVASHSMRGTSGVGTIVGYTATFTPMRSIPTTTVGSNTDASNVTSFSIGGALSSAGTPSSYVWRVTCSVANTDTYVDSQIVTRSAEL